MLDFLIFIYLFWRITAGFRSKLSYELNTLLSRLMLIAAALGFFLLAEFSGLIKSVMEQVTSESGFMITLVSMILSITILFLFRSKVIDNIESLISPRHHKLAAVLISFIRGVLVAGFGLFVLSHFPFALFENSLSESIFIFWL